MKKLLLASAFLFSPMIALANSGVCNTSDSNFCTCFKANAIQNCLQKGPKHHISPRMCKWNFVSMGIRKTTNVSYFCHRYTYMFPDDATTQDCLNGVTLAKARCL